MMKLSKTMLASAGVLSLLMLTACSAATPGNVQQSAQTGELAPCPDSPNCVSTLAPQADAQHYIEPITYSGSAAEARQRILNAVAAMPRTKVLTDQEQYIHATFTSLVFRFVDDVEFVIDDEAKMIHFRSAARVGYGDMGVNRKRMEEIRTRFMQAAAP